MTLYEPWILYKVFQSINLHVYTPSTPRSESYFGSHRGWIFIFVTIQIWAVLLIGWSKFWRQPRQCFIGERISPTTIQRQERMIAHSLLTTANTLGKWRQTSGNAIVAVLFVMLGSNILNIFLQELQKANRYHLGETQTNPSFPNRGRNYDYLVTCIGKKCLSGDFFALITV